LGSANTLQRSWQQLASLLGKTCSQRKLTRKVSGPRARFNDRLELPGWPGKDGTALTLRYVWHLWKREFEEVSVCTGVASLGGAHW
jgi:hypothetical protein